ncbi:uncharacterized protein LOC117787335 [Drosophila innubila]|uniref:uncharacterized protein LOC117787335 n=1 Tax=Drosophila innubila TaxID=198719 RepID=UPI00148C333B|nr:uncharacterized protein LOC117787335 [Drosophila innubila]
MALNWICVTLALFLCLSSCIQAAPSGENWSQFGVLERTLKELATTVLAMSGAGVRAGGDAADSFDEVDMDVLGSEAAAALEDLNEFHI